MRGFFSAKYCYRFFFYYLTAYLRALIETENADARATLTREMAEFLIGCWINARMNAADDAAKQNKHGKRASPKSGGARYGFGKGQFRLFRRRMT